jgi:hypothetical protein
MDRSLLVGIAGVAFLILARHYAARRLAARHGPFIFVLFLPTLIFGFLVVGIGIRGLGSSPAVGAVIVLTGSVYLALLLGFLTKASRSVSSGRPGDDVVEALTQPLGEFMTSVMGLVLIGGLAGLVGLLVWAASQAAAR